MIHIKFIYEELEQRVSKLEQEAIDYKLRKRTTFTIRLPIAPGEIE